MLKHNFFMFYISWFVLVFDCLFQVKYKTVSANKTLQKLARCSSHWTLSLPMKLTKYLKKNLWKKVPGTHCISIAEGYYGHWGLGVNEGTPTGVRFTVTWDTLCSLGWAVGQTTHSRLVNCRTWETHCHPWGCELQWLTFLLCDSRR